jgi:hypothetical protein
MKQKLEANLKNKASNIKTEYQPEFPWFLFHKLFDATEHRRPFCTNIFPAHTTF